MTKPVRWGLIGASDIAATRMIPAMRKRGDSVVAVCSGNAEHAAKYARDHDIGTATTQLDELCGRDDVEAVYISSTNDKHRVQALAAAAAGKHVLCEKPLALSTDDGAEIVRACDAAGVVLAVNHHLPGAGTHREMRRLLAAGAIGRPLAVRVAHAVLLPERLRGWRLSGAPGSGVILDITCHDAAAVQALLDRRPLDAVASSVRQGSWVTDPGTDEQSPDAVMSVLRYDDGVLVQTHDAFTVDFAPTRVEVFGTDGTLVGDGVMTQDPTGSIHLSDRSGTREIDVADRHDLYAVVLDAFAAAVTGTGRPTVTGEQGLLALATALAVAEATETGLRVPVRTS